MKERLEDLDYADDIRMLDQRCCDMDEKLKRLKEEAESAGLYINTNKTKGMRVNPAHRSTNFPNNLQPPQNSRRQESYIRQIPYRGHINIRRHCT